MKKSLLIFCLLTGNFFLFGQDIYLKLKLHPNEEFKSHNNSIEFEEMLSKVSQKFKSNGLEARYPNAKNPELALYYNFKGEGETKDAIQELKAFGIFESVAEEEWVQTALCLNPYPPVNDSWIVQGWASYYPLELIEANCAWSISKGCSSVYIGIADTDFEDTHEDLENQIAWLDGQVSEYHHHGTAVAGVAAAETNNNVGIAAIGYNSKIAARRVPHTNHGHSASTSGAHISNAIWNLYQAGRPIINVSWSSTGLDVAAAEEITQNGTTLVLAGGNTPASLWHSGIADVPGVIVVTSVNWENKYVDHARNQYIDICAPGYGITTTREGNTYSPGSGTSLAAPIVSGTIALMFEVNPCLTPSEIELLIKESADPVANGADFEGLLGAGRLNAFRAVKMTGTRNIHNTTLTGNMIHSAGYGFNVTNTNIGFSSHITLKARKEVNIESLVVPLGASFEVVIDPAAINKDYNQPVFEFSLNVNWVQMGPTGQLQFGYSIKNVSNSTKTFYLKGTANNDSMSTSTASHTLSAGHGTGGMLPMELP